MEHFEIITNHQYNGLNPVQFGYGAVGSGYSFGPAVRTFWLLHYVVSGYGKYVKDNITYEVSPGQIFVIPPYEKTYYEADKKNPWQYIWIGFTTNEPLPRMFYDSVIICPSAKAVFEEMKHCCKLNTGKSAFLSSCLWKLISLLLEQNKKSFDYVDNAISCMNSEYSSGITIKDVSDRLGLNRSYFSALFSRRMGVSPSDYLSNLRLERAIELLTLYHESPSVVATSVGYKDLYHFSRMFKKHYGMSPREYVKNSPHQALKDS